MTGMRDSFCRPDLPAGESGKRTGVEQLVARGVHNPEVAGSNPAPSIGRQRRRWRDMKSRSVETRTAVLGVGSKPDAMPDLGKCLAFHVPIFLKEFCDGRRQSGVGAQAE
jgi:hypothetical protein